MIIANNPFSPLGEKGYRDMRSKKWQSSNNNIVTCSGNIYGDIYSVYLHGDLNPKPSPYKGVGLIGDKKDIVMLPGYYKI